MARMDDYFLDWKQQVYFFNSIDANDSYFHGIHEYSFLNCPICYKFAISAASVAELTNGTETVSHLCPSQNAFDHYEANLILFKDLSLWRRGKKTPALNKILRFLFALFSAKMLQMYY